MAKRPPSAGNRYTRGACAPRMCSARAGRRRDRVRVPRGGALPCVSPAAGSGAAVGRQGVAPRRVAAPRRPGGLCAALKRIPGLGGPAAASLACDGRGGPRGACALAALTARPAVLPATGPAAARSRSARRIQAAAAAAAAFGDTTPTMPPA